MYGVIIFHACSQILPSFKLEAVVRRLMLFYSSGYVEIKCQLDATEVFIADLIAYSTCFGHHYALIL